jgi:hypothetical protein
MQLLLLTSTITPNVSIKNKSSQELDVNSRVKDYLRALVYYITQSDFDAIVFCDNSNTYLPNHDFPEKTIFLILCYT